MELNSSFSRHTILWKVILCYLTPLALTVSYRTFVNNSNDWTALTLGIFLSLIGCLIIFSLLYSNQTKNNVLETPQQDLPFSNDSLLKDETLPQVDNQALTTTLEENQHLHAEIDLLLIKQQTLVDENQLLTHQLENVNSDLETYKKETFEQLEQQQLLIRELQNTVADQKNHIEKRQQQIGHLDTKVGDLTYEIKTLLKLAEASPSSSHLDLLEENHSSAVALKAPPRNRTEETLRTVTEKQIKSAEEASLQLKRCLDISQKITGSYRFNGNLQPSVESTAGNYTLDLRRLCDTLRSEVGGVILLYSPKDNQVLFVNNQIKTLTGWSPEKFIQNFPEIVNEMAPWKQGLAGLAMRNETTIKLTLKTRSGQEITAHTHLGLIPTGIFRHYAIAILWSPLTSTI